MSTRGESTETVKSTDAQLRALGEAFDQSAKPTDADQAFTDLFAQIEQDRQEPLSKIRSQPTWLRRLIALVVLVVMAVLSIPLAPRADLASYPFLRMVAHVGALLSLGALCVWVALKPMHVPMWSKSRAGLAIALAIASTFVLCAVPTLDGGVNGSALSCFLFGSMLSVPVFVVTRILDRGALLSAVLAGSAAGLAGNVALQLHCPVRDVGHLLGSHFTVLLALVAVGLLSWVRARVVHSQRE